MLKITSNHLAPLKTRDNTNAHQPSPPRQQQRLQSPLSAIIKSKAGDRTIIRDVCRIAHHNDEAYVGALAVVLSIRSVLAGIWSQQHSFLSAVVDSLPDSVVRDRIEELIQLQLSPSRVSSHFTASGHVVAAVPLALHYAQ
jgi:ADP-ribosylglycohydrolase